MNQTLSEQKKFLRRKDWKAGLVDKILGEEELNRILDVYSMTEPGISGKKLLTH